MDKEARNMVFVCVVAGLIIVLGHLLCSAQESRVFNKLTGSDTTMMDACFVQLRVVEPVELIDGN